MNNNDYRPLPFWSWNEDLDENKLIEQIHWMKSQGIGGFFMHARGGLITPYLGKKWFSCVDACVKEANKLGMNAYAYDENGWPSGFCGGKLLEDENNKDCYVTYQIGKFDINASYAYEINSPHNIIKSGDKVINVYITRSSSTADVCSKEVVHKFIESTHEKYKEVDKEHLLKGFFTDEPQYYRQRVPFSYSLVAYFEENYKENVFNKLYLLFLEEEGYEEFRYRYYKGLNYLLTHNFGEQIYNWCEENDYKLTGHYIEESSLNHQMMCCAGIMSLYEYEHIPGIDWLSRNIGRNDLCPRQVSSVAAQLDKPLVLGEIFAMTGWDVSPRDYKHIADWLLINGVNVICHHLLPYSEKGDRKRDYPAHFSKFNPWINEGFKEFNEYYSSLASKLGETKEEVSTLVFHPIRSAYFNYKRESTEPGRGILDLDESLSDTILTLRENHIAYHFLDETIFQKYGSIKDKQIIIGSCRYDYLVFPKVLTMDKETEKLISKFISNGGKVLFMDEQPTYLEGQKHEYHYRSNVTLEDIKSSQSFTSSNNQNVIISHRICRDNDFFYAVNLGESTTCEINGKEFKFAKYESKLITEEDFKKKDSNKELISFPDKFTLLEPVNNYLKLDNVYYSKDGVNYVGPVNYMHALARLIKEKYCGKLYLKYCFVNKDYSSNIEVLIEDSNIVSVLSNGKEIKHIGNSQYESSMRIYPINNLIKGENYIVVVMNFFESPTVYSVWYDKNVLENIKNSLAYDSNIESIYLRGKFGVYGNFKDGKDSRLIVGNNFYLSKQGNRISNFIEDGFPFFRGKMKLSTSIIAKTNCASLVLPEHYQIIDLSINSNHVKKLMFESNIDLPNVKIGENSLDFDLIVSNRNILGPNHETCQENYSIGPFSWERIGRWDDPSFDDFITDYTFVKPIY